MFIWNVLSFRHDCAIYSRYFQRMWSGKKMKIRKPKRKLFRTRPLQRFFHWNVHESKCVFFLLSERFSNIKSRASRTCLILCNTENSIRCIGFNLSSLANIAVYVRANGRSKILLVKANFCEYYTRRFSSFSLITSTIGN